MASWIRPRHKAPFLAALTLAVVPLVLTTSQPATNPVAGARQAPRVAAPLVETDFAVPSRSSARFALLEQVEPELVQLAVAAEVEAKRKVKVSGPKGTRVWTASAMSDHNVPSAAERAYRTAARTMAATDPGCQLPWTLLAGIGRVESDHGRYGGSVLGSDGVSHPLIIGVQLNGIGPVAAIRDTDNGRLDKDKVWDRAVGPMQFIPSTWAFAARDGDGDGVQSPNDLDDAALAAAGYLCSGSGTVLGEAAMSTAIYRYNQDDYYVALVMAFERGYRTGVFVMPPPPVVEEETRPRRRRDRDAKPGDDRPRAAKPGDKPSGGTSGSGTDSAPAPKPAPKPTTEPTTKPSGGSTPKPSPTPSPTPTPSPAPSPTPSAPQLVSVSGAFSACGAPSGWCLDGSPLDLGPVVLTGSAADDFDGNGTTGTNADELAGLAGTQPTLQVEKTSTGTVVYVINGMDYRLADGTLA